MAKITDKEDSVVWYMRDEIKKANIGNRRIADNSPCETTSACRLVSLRSSEDKTPPQMFNNTRERSFFVI